MSELQNDGLTIDAASDHVAEVTEVKETPVVESPAVEVEKPIEKPESGSELAPVVSEEEKEAKRQAAFNKQYGEKKQAERERDEAQRKYDELQKQNQQLATPQSVGQMPDSLDYDTPAEYEEAKTQFIKRVEANAAYVSQNAAAEASRAQGIAAQQRADNEARNTTIASYADTACKLGISPEELQQAGSAVYNYGLNNGMVDAILVEPEGPLITKYLAANPQVVGQLNGMSPHQQGAYMVTLKAKAGELKPRSSSTPTPTTDIGGSGGEVKKDHPLIQDCSFE